MYNWTGKDIENLSPSRNGGEKTKARSCTAGGRILERPLGKRGQLSIGNGPRVAQ